MNVCPAQDFIDGNVRRTNQPISVMKHLTSLALMLSVCATSTSAKAQVTRPAAEQALAREIY